MKKPTPPGERGVSTPRPTRWPLVPLREVLQLQRRWIKLAPTQTYREIGVRSFGKGIFHKAPIEGIALGNKRVLRIEPGDLVFNNVFAWEGAVAVAGADEAGMIGSHRFITYTVNPNKATAEFLKLFFATPGGLELLLKASPGSAGRNKTLGLDRFISQSIPLPPLADQRRVVARIEELAAQIHEARTLRQQTVVESRALTAATANAKFSGSWPLSRLDEICPVITDGTHITPSYVDEGAIFLSAQNVKPFRFMPENHRKVSIDDFHRYTIRNKPQKSDVLLTRVGAGIGEAAVVDRNIEFAFYVSLALLRPDNARMLPEFLVHWLNSPLGRAHSRRDTLGRGHSQGNLNLKLLRGFNVPTPSLAEQRRIVAELDALQAEVDTLKRLQAETAAELDALLPAILDRAFKGEL